MKSKQFGSRFTIQTELASRDTCSIYTACDNNLGDKLVALKVFHVELTGDQIANYNNEIKLLRSASHPALVPIIAGGIDEHVPFIAMELIQGLAFKDAVRPYAVDKVLQYLQDLAYGLQESSKCRAWTY